ncbi:hypothetical protein JAAARDRAFT_397441 [Jaapia argillacea MUCL 33604]|uniref:Uncharacterized protein n=1 Tax=Jaapia argillacea MUCL 33604 TaxID=933084 RepID=A0A067PTC5_9AGAM|nr:hypothetical protein JAAARDRAFT_397441 [Jaapia argillacea MUCL 33604]
METSLCRQPSLPDILNLLAADSPRTPLFYDYERPRTSIKKFSASLRTPCFFPPTNLPSVLEIIALVAGLAGVWGLILSNIPDNEKNLSNSHISTPNPTLDRHHIGTGWS